MSGGSMDYLFGRIEDQIHVIPDREIRMLAKDFAKLMYECEWYTSCDTSEEQWLEALNKFKNKWFGKGKREARLERMINEEIIDLKTELLKMIGNTK